MDYSSLDRSSPMSIPGSHSGFSMWGLFCFFLVICVNEAVGVEPPRTEILFEHEVEAALTKLGCNAGTCHGSLHGKGGFRLSLRGQDPNLDYQSIAMDLAGRRLDLVDPEQSLLLAKPSGGVPHQGGLRLPKDSPYYEALKTWVDQGAMGPRSSSMNDPTKTGLKTLQAITLEPSDIWLRLPTCEQQLTATARWSDGTTSDITAWARYECSSIHGAMIDANALLHVSQPLDTTVTAFYLGQRASSRLVFLPDTADEPLRQTIPPGELERNEIDRLINARLNKLGIQAEPLASPEMFLRRIYLTTLGRTPRLEEQDRFFSLSDELRTESTIDQVLSDPSYASLWALKWSDLLRNEPKVMSEEGVGKWHDWLRDAMAQDIPVNQLVMEMLTTIGSTYENPAASFHRTHRDPEAAAEAIGQVFLGIRMQCARCHNHPFEIWTQDDYYGLAAYLAPVERKQVDNMPSDKLDTHVITGDEIISIGEKAPVFLHPGRSKFIAAKGLGEPVVIANDDQGGVAGDRPLDRLAIWLGSNNRQFARNMANRIWTHAMGRGIVDPPDDFRASNPASNPELLEYLTDQLIANQYSTRSLMREILRSHAFSRATLSLSQSSPRYETAIANFAGFGTNRMIAEVLHDSILDVSGSSTHLKRPSKREDDEPSTQRFRAIDFPSVPKRNVLLRAFGKPERLLDCDCERSKDLSLRQSLLLVNDGSIRAQFRDKNGNIARWSSLPFDTAVANLYRTSLCRMPSEQEMIALRAHASTVEDSAQVLEDIAWALINSKEFLFVR